MSRGVMHTVTRPDEGGRTDGASEGEDDPTNAETGGLVDGEETVGWVYVVVGTGLGAVRRRCR